MGQLKEARRSEHLRAAAFCFVLVQGVTQNMLRSASRWGCFLGFFREDILRWRDLSEQLDSTPEPESRDCPDVLACVICALAFTGMLRGPQLPLDSVAVLCCQAVLLLHGQISQTVTFCQLVLGLWRDACQFYLLIIWVGRSTR